MKKTNEVSRRSAISGTIKAPSSKSYAQRAIAAGLLAEGVTVLHNLELCSDTEAAMEVIKALGARVEKTGQAEYSIEGVTGRAEPEIVSTLDIGESGLSARMFIPIVALHNKPVTVQGRGSILTRPMEQLIVPLRLLGVGISTNGGHLPITVTGPMQGGEAMVDGSVSSQFLTGLLMALPLAQQGTMIKVGKLSSVPYIEMTLDVLESFGIEAGHNQYMEFYVEGNQRYEACSYDIEGDWSGASCMLVAGAIAGGISIENLNSLSKQADRAIAELLSRVGAEVVTTANAISVRGEGRELKAFEYDATHSPDLFPALVALAANCRGESIIHGISRLKDKESNRAHTLKEEFAKMGIEVDISQANSMKVTGGKVRSATVTSHNDHRIAMATAVAALRSDDRVTIEGAESVEKSYPNFWRDLESLRVG